jgi:hypothetical protein
MTKTEIIITCNRASAEQVIAELIRYDDSTFTVRNEAKRLSGLVDSLSIVASLTTVAHTAFMIWLHKRQDRDMIEVREAADETGHDDRT